MSITPQSVDYYLDRQLAGYLFWEFCTFYDPDFFIARPFLEPMAYAMQWVYDEYVQGRARSVAISLPPRAGKCLHPDSKVYTPNGWKRIKDVEPGDVVLSYSAGNVVNETVIAKESSVKKQVKIKYQTGETIVCSPEHKLLTFDGYKQAQDISLSDFLIGYSSELPADDVSIPDAELKFVSYMIFEGHCKKNHLGFTAMEDYTIQDFLNVCKELKIVTDVRSKQNTDAKQIMCRSESGRKYDKSKYKHNGDEILERYGILGHLCYTKRLPHQFYTMPVSQKWDFLSIMFRTDGWFDKKNGAVTLANELLIEDIKYLCNTLGLKTTTSRKYSKQFDSYSWTLSFGRSQIEKIVKNCDLGHKAPAAEKLLEKDGYSFLEVYPRKIGYDFTTLQQRELRIGSDNTKNITKDKFARLKIIRPDICKYEMNDFYYIKIKSIEAIDEQIEMFDIQTTGVNNFIVNGIVSHNSYLTSLFCAWWLGKLPELAVMRNSNTARLYKKLSYDTRKVIKSDKYQMVFPHIHLAEDKQDVSGWSLQTSRQVGYFGAGTGGAIIGFGANLAVYDDLYKGIIDALNNKVNEDTLAWKGGDHNSRKELNCPEIGVGTRWRMDDVIGNEITKGNVDKVFKQAALIHDPVTKTWHSFCDNVNNTAFYLKEKRDNDPIIFNPQYMQEPVESFGLMFPLKELHFYDPKAVNVPAQSKYRLGVIDPANKGGDDLSAPAGYLITNQIYIHDVIYNNDGTDVNEDACVMFIKDNKLSEVRFEGNGGWFQFGMDIRRRMEEKRMDCELRITKNTVNKHTRILAQSAFIRNYFYFRADWEDLPQYRKFMRNLTSYMKDGGAEHDDAPDSLAELAKFFRENVPELW